ncbi:MAG: family metallo-hydrolase [Bacillota bacterium]|jgi:arginine utilization protein RocB|nr:family metallo-hydrolase [Bacillota bacterium]
MSIDKNEISNLIERNLLEFVGTRSDTNSKEEKNIEQFFQNWFSSVEYFKKNPEYCGFFEIPNDYLDRKVSWCLLKGKGNDTVVFIHHNDIVETKDYGTFEHLSLKPYELEKEYKKNSSQLPNNVMEDLFSEKWVFGRGVCDMKGGGSIQMSLVEEYSKDKDFKGNIVLLSVPDEENLSAGMRAGVLKLKELKDKYNLNYKVMINSEPHEREDDLKPTLYDGSIGKIMPVVYVRGKLAHVGQIYSGLNPINILSEIIRKTEVSAGFIEKRGNTTNPPPTWLYHKDRKIVYDVSLPKASCGYMSILPLEKTPMALMEKLKKISKRSFENVVKDLNKSYKKYTKIAGIEYKEILWEAKVKFYSELYKEALRDSGKEFEEAYLKVMSIIKNKFNNNEMSTIEAANIIIEKTLEYVKDLSPCVILALTPPYYPSTNNMMLKDKSNKVNELIDVIKKYAKDNFEEEYEVKNYFTGISDLSYAMYVSDQKDIDYIENNMLMWKDVYFIPLEEIKEISMPVINIGPWGKDFHKYTERVLKEDLFYKTPVLIDLFITQLFDK